MNTCSCRGMKKIRSQSKTRRIGHSPASFLSPRPLSKDIEFKCNSGCESELPPRLSGVLSNCRKRLVVPSCLTGINGLYNLFDRDGFHHCVFEIVT